MSETSQYIAQAAKTHKIDIEFCRCVKCVQIRLEELRSNVKCVDNFKRVCWAIRAAEVRLEQIYLLQGVDYSDKVDCFVKLVDEVKTICDSSSRTLGGDLDFIRIKKSLDLHFADIESLLATGKYEIVSKYEASKAEFLATCQK